MWAGELDQNLLAQAHHSINLLEVPRNLVPVALHVRTREACCTNCVNSVTAQEHKRAALEHMHAAEGREAGMRGRYSGDARTCSTR